MAKKNINAKEILADIKAGMNNAALMEKYQLSEKGLQSLFKKLVDAGVLKQREQEKGSSEPEKLIEYAWKCPACGMPQTTPCDECPDCGVIVAKYIQAPAKGELDDAQYVWKCSHCGKSQPKQFDQCPECGEIGSIVKTELSESVEESEDSTTGADSDPSSRRAFHKGNIGHVVQLIRTRQFKEVWQAYKFHIAVVCSGVVIILLSYIGYKALSLPYESDLPKPIEQRVVAHYSNQDSWTKLADIRVLKAVEGVPTQKVKDVTNPKKVFCVSFLAKVLNGHSEDPLSPRVFNVIVFEARSGKLSGTILQKGDSEKESNCPPDWDNICPFTCDCHDELVVGLREARRKAFEEEQVRRIAEETRKREEALQKEEEARKKAEEVRKKEEQIREAARKREEEAREAARKREEEARREKNRKNALLVLAASKGDSEAAGSALSQGAEIDGTDENGNTALISGYLGGHIDIVKFLLEQGAKPDVTGKEGATMLVMASRDGRTEFVKLLIASGAFVNSLYGNGDTPIILAANNDHKDLVRFLAEKGADKESALMAMTRQNNKEMMKLLLQLGANPDRILSLACGEGDLGRLRIVLDNASDLAIGSLNRHLIQASEKCQIDVAKALIEKGADINAANEQGITPLHWAVMKESREAVQLFVSSGANAGQSNKAGYSPLDLACVGANLALIETFIKMGATVSGECKNAALREATNKGQKEAIQFFLENGADVNGEDSDGNSALMLAYKNDAPEILRLLLAERRNRSSEPNSAVLEMAVNNGDMEVAKLLLDHGASADVKSTSGEPLLMVACNRGHEKMVRFFLERGADVNAKDRNGTTPLIVASAMKSTDIVKLLLEKGADVNARGADSKTPLMAAALAGRKEAAKLLLEKGADANVVDKNGITPLMRVCDSGNLELVKLFLGKGASVNIKSRSGETALKFATRRGLIEAVILLLEKGAKK